MTADARDDDEIPCVQVVSLITDYLDSALPTTDRALIDLHLADCDGCLAVLEQFRTTIAATGRLPTGDVDRLDAPTRTRLMSAFREWSADRPTD